MMEMTQKALDMVYAANAIYEENAELLDGVTHDRAYWAARDALKAATKAAGSYATALRRAHYVAGQGWDSDDACAASTIAREVVSKFLHY